MFSVPRFGCVNTMGRDDANNGNHYVAVQSDKVRVRSLVTPIIALPAREQGTAFPTKPFAWITVVFL